MRSPLTFVLLTILCVYGEAGCGDDSPGDGDAAADTGPFIGCGNGILEPGEQCDGTDFADQTCRTATGHQQGELRCTPDCRRDVTLCHTCGNGVAERAEECDSPDLRGNTCATLDPDLPDGELRCQHGCAFDTTSCHRCGNGTVEADEECDSSPSGLTCQDLGFETIDPVGCRTDCRHDRSACFTCGDGLCSAPYETWQTCPEECGWAKVIRHRWHLCGLRRDGTVWCWGCNSEGELGDGTQTSREAPTKAVGLSSVVDIAAGQYHSCAVRSNGTVWCWGANFSGQLGDGSTQYRATPAQAVGLTGCTRIAADQNHTCAVCGGEAWCWGERDWNESSPIPTPVSGLPAPVVELGTGWYHSCAALDNGTAWCWGLNYSGQLGDGTTTDSATPVQIVGVTDVATVSAYEQGSCALNSNGTGWCWGDNNAGQLGSGTTDPLSATPILAPGTGDDLFLENTATHGCAIEADGTARCWGSNVDGALGDGTRNESLTPVRVAGLTGLGSLSLAGARSSAVSKTGVIWMWGYGGGDCTNSTQSSGQPSPLCEGDDCGRCGNGLREPLSYEACEGADLGGLRCTDFCGYTGGLLACGSDCTPDFSGCLGGPVCGDNVAECPDQLCDGSDLRGLGCPDAGFASGTLACDASCLHDTSGCTDRLWYLYEPFEGPTAQMWSYGGLWEWGEPTYGYGPAPYAGQQCAGTDLDSGFAGGMTNEVHALISPPVDLTQAIAPRLEFFQWVGTMGEGGGSLWISTDDGATWTAPDASSLEFPENYWFFGGCAGADTVTGEFPEWHRIGADLSSYVGQTIRLKFSMCSEPQIYGDGAGWYLDEIRIAEPAHLPVRHLSPTDLGTALVGEPFYFQLRAIGGTGNLGWSIQPGGTNDAWLSIDPATGVLSGIPGASDLGPVYLTVRVAEPTVPGNFVDKSFTLNVSQAFFYESFDNGPGAFFEPFDCDWGWGTPSNVGPPSCYGGSAGCFGTVMNDLHSNDIALGMCNLMSPPIDLTAATAPYLVYQQYVEAFTGAGLIMVSNDFGSNWFPLSDFLFDPYDYSFPPPMCAQMGPVGALVGFGGGWSQQTVDLGAFAGQMIMLNFAFCADDAPGGQAAGWYIDDVMVLQ
ncbi:MAG: hypothetical protein ABI333_17060 [bacterium]